MQSLFGLGSSAEIQIVLNDEDERKSVEAKLDKEKTQSFPLYFDGDSVVGKAQIRIRDGKKCEHQGIKVEFIGHLQLFYDRGNHSEFLSLTKELASPGELRNTSTFDFEFKNVEKMYESYIGINVKLRYIWVDQDTLFESLLLVDSRPLYRNEIFGSIHIVHHPRL